MSGDHKLEIDVNRIAWAIQRMRHELDAIEDELQKALMKEVHNGVINSDTAGSLRS